jgi:hypothetical protein
MFRTHGKANSTQPVKDVAEGELVGVRNTSGATDSFGDISYVTVRAIMRLDIKAKPPYHMELLHHLLGWNGQPDL